MPAKRTSSRREFLKGQAAVEALGDLASGVPAEGVALPRPAEDSYLVQLGRRAMACQFQVFLNAGEYAHGTATALAALDLVDELEAQMTVYRESSEIMDINRQAAEQAVLVERRLFELLQLAAALHAQTAGAFDITSGPLSKVWGFYRRQGAIPAETDLQQALNRVGSRYLQLDAQQQTVRFLRPGMELNLGSIGKGYALDRCAELLAAAGVEQFLLHGGQSSVLARGCRGPHAPDEGWPVAIGHPLRPGKAIAELRLRDRCLGTSGSGTQFFRHGGRRYGHILDPRSGWPAQGMLSASVVAPTAAEADALATAFYVLGREKSLEICSERPEIGALLVSSAARDGQPQVVTANLEAADLTIRPPN